MAFDYHTILEKIRQGGWDDAHKVMQMRLDPLSCQIHGYLHRIEDDLGNATYWYQKGGLALPENSLDEEFARLKELADAISRK